MDPAENWGLRNWPTRAHCKIFARSEESQASDLVPLSGRKFWQVGVFTFTFTLSPNFYLHTYLFHLVVYASNCLFEPTIITIWLIYSDIIIALHTVRLRNSFLLFIGCARFDVRQAFTHSLRVVHFLLLLWPFCWPLLSSRLAPTFSIRRVTYALEHLFSCGHFWYVRMLFVWMPIVFSLLSRFYMPLKHDYYYPISKTLMPFIWRSHTLLFLNNFLIAKLMMNICGTRIKNK